MANKLCDETMTALILLVLAQVAHADTLADQAQALLDQGKAKAAHNLLDTHESERAGDVNFDLSFGIAAVDDGQNTRGEMCIRDRVWGSQRTSCCQRSLTTSDVAFLQSSWEILMCGAIFPMCERSSRLIAIYWKSALSGR